MQQKYFWIIGIIIVAVVVAIFLINPIQKIPENEPKWVNELITNKINNPVANPPASLSKCTYKGEIVYYLPPRCCDVYSVLFNENGNVICSPDGGFTGDGDGRCTDFFEERKNCEVIWKDSRSYP